MKTLSVLSFAACSFLFLLFEKDYNETPNSDKEFERFIKLFPEGELPFSISIDDFDNATFRKNLVVEIRTFENKFLSDLRRSFRVRVGRIVVEPIQVFKTDDDFFVFIYSTHHVTGTHLLWGENSVTKQRPSKFSKIYKCAVLNERGVETNKYPFSLGENRCRETKTSSINKEGVIKLATFENNCQKGGGLYGLGYYEGIAGRKNKKVTSFKINKQGIFEELKEPSTTARASL